MHVPHTTRCCVAGMAMLLGACVAPAQTATPPNAQQIAAAEKSGGVRPLAMPTEGVAPGYAGMLYHSSVMMQGGVGPYQVLVSGELPAGVSYQPGANVVVFSGVPTATGTFNSTITVIDAYGAQATHTYSFDVRPVSNVTPSPAVISDAEAMHITDGQSVFFPATISIPEAMHITDGMMDFSSARLALPEAFHINDKTSVFLAIQYGLPEAFHINDKTTVLLGAQYALPEAFHINDATSVKTSVGIFPATVPAGTYNVSYSQTFTAAGNTGTATFTPTGALPAGMGFTASAGQIRLSGTPTVTGTFPFTLKVVDSGAGGTNTVSYSLVINGTAQTITVGTIPSVTYGAGNFGLSATASPSGLPVTIASTSALVTGTNPFVPVAAGTATFQATQAGNATYAAATPVNFNVTIAKATLNVTASGTSRVFDQPNPSFGYGLSNFVNGENASVVSGTPSITATATAISPVSGSPYAIVPSAGTLAAANYTFNFISGSLTVTKAAQTITFYPLPNVANGTTFPLSARASSGLAVSYTVSGGSITNNVLTVTASSGSLVTVTASQSGNGNYNAATSVVRSFTAQ